MAAKRKKGFSAYILPVLFCALLVVLAIVKGRQGEQPVKAVLQAAEPLTLSEQAVENYLYAAGFTLEGEAVLDETGEKIADLTMTRDDDGTISSMTLSFPLPTYIPTENDEDLASVREPHDRAAQRGNDMFLAIFDAIAATDKRVAARRDSAETKLQTAMDTGKAAQQAANSWRFDFSMERGMFESTVTILFTLVK